MLCVSLFHYGISVHIVQNLGRFLEKRANIYLVEEIKIFYCGSFFLHKTEMFYLYLMCFFVLWKQREMLFFSLILRNICKLFIVITWWCTEVSVMTYYIRVTSILSENNKFKVWFQTVIQYVLPSDCWGERTLCLNRYIRIITINN